MSDLLGYLGLDTRDFESGIKRAERATGAFAKAGIIATGAFAAVAVAINSFRNLGTEIDATRAKLVHGTAEAREFDDAIGKTGSTGLQRTGRKLDNFLTRMKGMGAAVAEVTSSLVADLISAATGGAKGEIQAIDAAARKADATSDQLKKKAEKQEDAISYKRQRGIVTYGDQEKLLLMTIDLEKTRLELYSEGAAQDRDKANAAKESLGLLEEELAMLSIANNNEGIRAFTKANAMKAEARGMTEQAKLLETLADYDERILKAKREQKGFLVDQLTLQRNIALQVQAVAEHNKTPRERLEQRRTERKFERDFKKTVAHEGDLDARLERAKREGHAPARGSELDRHARRRQAEAGARVAIGKAAGQADPQVKMVTHLESIDKKMTAAFKQL